MNKYLKLFISIIIPISAGAIGAIFTTPNISTWYAALNKPSFNPPNWIFAPVWNILFVLMGIALFLIWNKKEKSKKRTMAFVVFGVQLFLNILWSILFFGLRNPLYGLIEIVFLWIAILINIIIFWRLKHISGALLLPYVAWVSFAGVLNYYLYILNK